MILHYQMPHPSSQNNKELHPNSTSDNSNQGEDRSGFEYTPKRIRSPSLEKIYHQDDIQKKVIVKATKQGKIKAVKRDKDTIDQEKSTKKQKNKKKSKKSKSKTKNSQLQTDKFDQTKIQQKLDHKSTSKSKNKNSKKHTNQHKPCNKQPAHSDQKIQNTQQQSQVQSKPAKTKSKPKSKHKEQKNLSSQTFAVNGLQQQKVISKQTANTKTTNNTDKSSVTQAKKKSVQKQQSIMQIQRQFSKISRKKKRKSNFYLDKIDSLKWGEPVGRGSKKLRQQMQVERKKQLQYDRQRKKYLKQYYSNLTLSTKKEEERQSVKVEQIISSDSSESQSEEDNEEQSNESASLEAKQQESHLVKNQTSTTAYDSSYTVDNQTLKQIVDLYLVQGVDFLTLPKCIPNLSLKQLRHNISLLLAKGLDQISLYRQRQSNTPVNQWKQSEKNIIIKSLCRVKANNRLLNPNNHQFGQCLSRILASIFRQDVSISTIDYESSLKTLNSLVSTIRQDPSLRKDSQISPNFKNEELLIFLEQFYCDIVYYLYQWTKDEEEHLIIAYLEHGNNHKAIVQSKFTKKYRNSVKWRDEDIVSTKINELILRGLNKLYDLTEPISLNQEQDQNSHRPDPSLEAQTFKDSIKHIYRKNRQCQLNFFTNYAQLLKRIFQSNSILSKQVNKKLIGLNIKSNHADIQEAIKALHYFNQLPQWKVNNIIKDQPKQEENQ